MRARLIALLDFADRPEVHLNLRTSLTVNSLQYGFAAYSQTHVETALEDSEILVTKQEPDPADSQSRVL